MPSAKRMRRVLVCAAMLCASAGACGPADAAGRSWSGTYLCAQGITGLTLTILKDATGQSEALFHFYGVTGNAGVPEGCFDMAGVANADGGPLDLKPRNWRLQPPNYVMVGLIGAIDGAGHLTGQVEGPGCTTFTLAPVAEDLARLAACSEPVS